MTLTVSHWKKIHIYIFHWRSWCQWRQMEPLWCPATLSISRQYQPVMGFGHVLIPVIKNANIVPLKSHTTPGIQRWSFATDGDLMSQQGQSTAPFLSYLFRLKKVHGVQSTEWMQDLAFVTDITGKLNYSQFIWAVNCNTNKNISDKISGADSEPRLTSFSVYFSKGHLFTFSLYP